MQPERRAVIFDLDDTLYPYRRFVLSGFVAVADHLARTTRIDRRRAFRVLVRASRGDGRGSELQACLVAFGLPMTMLPMLVNVLLQHQPRLSLPRPVFRMLNVLRSEGWRIGVLTNGSRGVQARKIAALGLIRYVDSVVYATEHGQRRGKPDPEPFVEILSRLGVASSNAVFVGDDEHCDIGGARRSGLLTVRCTVWRARGIATAAHAVVSRLSHFPHLAQRLLEETANRHAA